MGKGSLILQPPYESDKKIATKKPPYRGLICCKFYADTKAITTAIPKPMNAPIIPASMFSSIQSDIAKNGFLIIKDSNQSKDLV